MIKLKDILQEVVGLDEVGEGSAQAYDWKKIRSSKYEFVTDDIDKEGSKLPPVDYKVDIIKTISPRAKIIEYYVAFGIEVLDFDEDGKYYFKTNYDVTSKDAYTGNLFRVMKTMVEIINDVLDNQKNDPDLKNYLHKFPTVIEMTPSKEKDAKGNEKQSDMRRANLYMAYIQKHKPEGSTVRMGPNGDSIKIEIKPR
jgi:hypothetical protein